MSLESSGIDNEAQLRHFRKPGMTRKTDFERDYGNSCNSGKKERETAEP